MRHAVLFAAAVTGVALGATPAFARTQQSDRIGIPCPAMPPSANIVSGKDGSIGLQLPGFGITGNRAQTKAESDVVIQSEGYEAWANMVLLKQACEAIRQRYPRDATRQLQELVKFRESLRRQTSEKDDKAISAGFENLFSTKLPPQARSAGPDTLSNAQPGLKRQTTKEQPKSIYAISGDEANILLESALNDNKSAPTSRASQGTIFSFSAEPARVSTSTSHGASKLFDVRATGSKSTTTCMSTPHTSQRPAIVIGNMLFDGVVSSSESVSCTTTF